jgi:hypothetical protein
LLFCRWKDTSPEKTTQQQWIAHRGLDGSLLDAQWTPGSTTGQMSQQFLISNSVLFSLILTNFASFCIFFHIANMKLKKNCSMEFSMENTSKTKASIELSSIPELGEEWNDLLILEMTDSLLFCVDNMFTHSRTCVCEWILSFCIWRSQICVCLVFILDFFL